MTIDETDYKPRPADDWHAMALLPGFSDVLFERATKDLPRYFSFIKREFWLKDYCHQLGCNFDELQKIAKRIKAMEKSINEED